MILVPANNLASIRIPTIIKEYMDTEEKEIIKFRFGEHNFLPPIRIAVPSNLTIKEKALFIHNIFSDKITEKYGYKIGLSVKKINNNKEKND